MTKLYDAFGRPLPSSMQTEETTTSTTTTTTVEEEVKDENNAEPTEQAEEVKVRDKSDELYVPTPIFLLFAEFLGYVSHFVQMAEDWCNPKKKFPSVIVKTFLEREARTIYDEMLAHYTEKEIHNLYKNFYTCGLDELESDYQEKMLALEENESDLPF